MSKLQLNIDGYLVDVTVSELGPAYQASADLIFPITCVAFDKATAVKGLHSMFTRFRNLSLNVVLDELEIAKCRY